MVTIKGDTLLVAVKDSKDTLCGELKGCEDTLS